MSFPPFLVNLTHPWVDAQMASMSLRQRIAQLLHVPAWSNRGEAHLAELRELVQTYGVGGMTFFQGSPTAQVAFTNDLQASASIPLLISIDAEWGLAMRLTDSPTLPYAMTLGAGATPELTEALVADLGQQLRRLGVHVNFGPVVDVNTEPSNPVIGFRAFGATPETVIPQALAYQRGLQQAGVLAVAKHFPGHGDTCYDSHLTLPSLPHDRHRLNAVEWPPFRAAIDAGVGGVMSAHLQVDHLDSRPFTPATLSAPILTGILREQLGFQGLIFTDAMDMKGIADHYGPAEAAWRALQAGNDVVIFCVDVPAALDRIEAAVQAGELSEAQIEASCRRLLAAKYWAGLADWQPLALKGLPDELFSAEASQWQRQIYRQSLQLKGAPPAIEPSHTGILSLVSTQRSDHLAHHQLTLTGEPGKRFEDTLTSHDSAFRRYPDLNAVMNDPPTSLLLALEGLSPKHGLRYGLTDELVSHIRAVVASIPTFVILFGRDQAWQEIFPSVEDAPHGLIAWQSHPDAYLAVWDWLKER